MTNHLHEPTPEFARFLEWQVASELRRRQRFAEQQRTMRLKPLGIAAMIIASMMVGAGGVAAAGRLQSNQQKHVLLAQQQGDVQLADLQVAAAQKALDEVSRRVNAGVATPLDLAKAKAELQVASLRRQRAQLDFDEVGQSGKPVQDNLTAPKVSGRDFVAERLAIDRDIALLGTSGASTRMADVQRRHEVGVANDIELAEAQDALVVANAETRIVSEKMALRQRFLSEKMSIDEVTRARQLLVARNQLPVAESALQLAAQRFARVQAQVRTGVVGEVDLLKAQVEMLTKKEDLAKLQERVRSLSK